MIGVKPGVVVTFERVTVGIYGNDSVHDHCPEQFAVICDHVADSVAVRWPKKGEVPGVELGFHAVAVGAYINGLPA